MKKILILILALILIVTLGGCKKNDLEDFTVALKKTDEIERGKLAAKSKVNMGFNTQGLTSEEIKDLNYIKDVEANMEVTYDSKLEKTIARNYFNFGGLGFDLNFYIDGEQVFIKMPMVGKYIVISDFFNEIDVDDKTNESEEFASEEAMNTIKTRLIDILKEDNVFSGKDSVLTTPDGEVKATEYSIKLDDKQIKELIDEAINILSNDEDLRKNIEKYIHHGIHEDDEDQQISLENLLGDLSKAVDKSEINDFTYIAFVDIDGHIVKEDIDFDISFKEVSSGKITGLKYTYEVDRWSINENQEFDYPELNEQNILDIDNFDEGVPFMFEDMLKVKK